MSRCRLTLLAAAVFLVALGGCKSKQEEAKAAKLLAIKVLPVSAEERDWATGEVRALWTAMDAQADPRAQARFAGPEGTFYRDLAVLTRTRFGTHTLEPRAADFEPLGQLANYRRPGTPRQHQFS